MPLVGLPFLILLTMKQSNTKRTNNTAKPTSTTELVEMLRTTMKFFTETTDGGYQLRAKSATELQGLLGRRYSEA